MPSEKRSRRLESLTGIGDVYEDDRPIARVRFSLTITQGLPGLKDIRGVITILDGDRHLVDGRTLVLQLRDGRRWEFFTLSGNFISGEYVVVGTGRQDIITS